MKVIKTAKINNKIAKLLLLDDNKTVRITLDNKTISSSAGNTWNNIKNDDWAQEGLLRLEVEVYMKKKNSVDKLKHMAKDLF